MKVTLKARLTIPYDCIFHGGSPKIKKPTEVIFTRNATRALTPKLLNSLMTRSGIRIFGTDKWEVSWKKSDGTVSLHLPLNHILSQADAKKMIKEGWRLNKESAEYYGAIKSKRSKPAKAKHSSGK
jgi:hypothetical protein